jgi:hypothetical protein
MEDEVDVIADNVCNHHRLLVAEAVAKARSCRTAGVAWIAMRGRKRNAEAAAQLYQSLMRRTVEDEQRAMGGAPESALEVWRTCYAMGFVPALEARLKAEKEPVDFGTPSGKAWSNAVETTTPDELRRARIDAAAQGAIRAAEHLAQVLDEQAVGDVWNRIDRLRRRAHMSGTRAGQEVALPPVVFVEVVPTTPAKSQPEPKPVSVLGALPPRRWKAWTRGPRKAWAQKPE